MKTIHYMLNYVLRLIWGVADLLGAPTSVIRVPLPPQVAELTPKDAQLEFVDVEIQSELGANPAWWVPARSDKWVIFVHGRGGDRVGALDMLPLMHAMHYNSLVISYRNDLGAPASPDGRDHLGATEWRDLEAAVAFAQDHGATHITVFARSAGAAITGQYLTRSVEAYLVDRVVFDNPVLDWEPTFLRAAPSWLPRWVGRLIIWGNMRRIGARTKQFNLVDEPPLHRPPTLILHASDDEVVPVRVSRRLERECPVNWSVVLVETEGGHAGGRFADTEQYMGVIAAWMYPERWDKTVVPPEVESTAVEVPA